MNVFIEGLFLGLSLSILTGPLFVALVETSLKKGPLSGIFVGLGIWISDITIVWLSYKFVSHVETIVNESTFRHWMGLAGGIVLIAIGAINLFKPKDGLVSDSRISSKLRYIGPLIKGFLINTINPFTFIFWLMIMSTYVIGRGITHVDATILLSTIIGVIIITDTVKVLAAHSIRQFLNKENINRLSRVAGICLIVFGIALLYKTATF